MRLGEWFASPTRVYMGGDSTPFPILVASSRTATGSKEWCCDQRSIECSMEKFWFGWLCFDTSVSRLSLLVYSFAVRSCICQWIAWLSVVMRVHVLSTRLAWAPDPSNFRLVVRLENSNLRVGRVLECRGGDLGTCSKRLPKTTSSSGHRLGTTVARCDAVLHVRLMVVSSKQLCTARHVVLCECVWLTVGRIDSEWRAWCSNDVAWPSCLTSIVMVV